MAAIGRKKLEERLRSADEEELGRLLDEHLEGLDVRLARQAFRNPFLTGEMIEALAASPRLASAYEVRRETAFHPRTPRILALRHVPGLYWADLVRLGADPRVHPVIRRAADQRLVERLPGLAVGEKMAIARSAGPGVVAALRQDPTPRVIAALLENPRLTEGLLMPLVASDAANPRALAVVAASPRWAVRPPIRAALCRNPATPVASALALLPMLGKTELAAVAADPRIAEPVRRRADLLAGGRSRGRGR